MTRSADTVLAWHFVGDRLRDGKPVPPDGKPLVHDGTLEMCVSGLHASERIIDALQYAPGPVVCRVECGGRIEYDTDKLICMRRIILWRIDGTQLLRSFARQCALDVSHLWKMPDVVKQYLETGDDSLGAAARDAARDAAWDAAWAAARDAAWDAARAAARDAAWAAARAAAWAAAWAAARDAAWAAARDAARDAAWAAARDAARAAQNERLTKMIEGARADG